MATFTITTPVNIDSLAAKGGADTYNINGGFLTVDQDSRYGVNNDTSAIMGTTTLSATLGGSLTVDSRAVRLIPYDTGSGVVPAYGTTISKGGASGLLIGVYDTLASAPTAPGAAVPADGYIKVKQWNTTTYSTGALTGIGANVITDPVFGGTDRQGWLEYVQQESTNFTLSRLNNPTTPISQGGWFDVGITDGTRSTTYQIPSNGVNQYHAGVWVETSAGAGTYEFYPASSDTMVSTNISTDAIKGKWCNITTAGLVRFGHDGTNSSGGYCPVTGCKVRIASNFFTGATSAAKTQNSYQATIATRPRWITTGAARLDLRYGSFNWSFGSVSTPQYFSIQHSSVVDNIAITNPSTEFTMDDVGIGSPIAFTATRLSLISIITGGTLTDVVVGVSGHAATANLYAMNTTDSTNLDLVRCKLIFSGQKGANTQYAWVASRTSFITFTDCTAAYSINAASTTDVTIENMTYFADNGIKNSSGNAQYVFTVTTLCTNWLVDGINIADGDMARNGLCSLGSSSSDMTFRNIGSLASPVGTGLYEEDGASWSRVTTTATVTTASPHLLTTGDIINVYRTDVGAAIPRQVYTVTVTGANTFTFTCTNSGATSGVLSYYTCQPARLLLLTGVSNIKFQNVHVVGVRTALYGMDNTCSDIYLENVSTDWRHDAATVPSANSLRMFGSTQTTVSQAAGSSIYGTMLRSGFVALTTVPNATAATYTRTTTTATVTKADHGLVSASRIQVHESSAPTTFPTATVTNITVLTKDTFTMACTNTGAASGTLDYTTPDGNVFIDCNEDNAEMDDYFTIVAGTPVFTGAGSLTMFTVNDEVVWESERYILDYSYPENMLPQMAGGTITNYELYYDLDTGSGFSGTYKNLYYQRAGGGGSSASTTVTMTSTTGVNAGDYVYGVGIATGAKVQSITNSTDIVVTIANTSAVSGTLVFNQLPNTSTFSSTGFKIRVKCKTITTNSAAITFIRIPFRSNSTTRANLYPQDVTTVTFGLTNIPSGSIVAIYDSTDVELARDNNVTSGEFEYLYEYAGTPTTNNYAVVWHEDYYAIKYEGLTFGATDQSVFVSPVDDLAYDAGAADVSTFDYGNKIHIMDYGVSSGDVIDIPLADLYSNWKDDITLSDNFIYDFAYEIVGGQPTFGSQFVSLYYFQQNGWKMRPEEENHTVTLSAGVLLAETGSPINKTVGAYNVFIDYQKPEHAITIELASALTPADITDIAEAVDAELLDNFAAIADEQTLPNLLIKDKLS